MDRFIYLGSTLSRNGKIDNEIDLCIAKASAFYGRLSKNVWNSRDTAEISKEEMKEIYRELQAISDKLREENNILHEREAKLKERERMLTISQESLQTVTDHQMRSKISALEEKFGSEIVQLEQTLKEKLKENKRLKENFETMKQANDALKKEIEVLTLRNSKLEKMSNSLQARFVNLQRKQEYDLKLKESDTMKQTTEISSNQQSRENTSQKLGEKLENKILKNNTPQNKQSVVQVYSTTVSILFDWICEAHLRQSLTELPIKPVETYKSLPFIQDKVVKILPNLVDILRDNSSNIHCGLPCLQFIYWSLLHLDQGQSPLSLNMSTTTRRIGEEIYYPKSSKVPDVEKMIGSSATLNEKLKEPLFMRSTNNHIRLLSTLIVLKTLSRADVIAQAFNMLKLELKSEHAKELFLYYQATNVILNYLKPIHKAFTSVAMEILLQMATDSPFQQMFFESCSNENFFRSAALLIRTPLPDIKVMERLSIILQKLSKLK
uniref:Coiled-coil domain-containing protein 138 n=1 Tax=Biomphalaria glabrata TaxID=6526 RepID=A0A2C9KPQ4_BIOGL